jgi:hypothetical protein
MFDLSFLCETDLLPGTPCTYRPEGVSGASVPEDAIDIRWSGTDSPQNYKDNFNSLEWREKWKDVFIDYKLNSNSYRCKEFDEVDWENSVAIFGDSCVFGMGVPEKDTVSHQLETMIGRPVINLGVAGCSNMYIMYNNMKLLSKHKPYAVINIWTTPDRATTFTKPRVGETGIKHWGSWNHEDRHYIRFWVREEINYLAHTSLCMETCSLLNKDNIYLQYTPKPHKPDTPKPHKPELKNNFPFYGGMARDNLHPDVFTYNLQAKYIKEDFKRYGWLD